MSSAGPSHQRPSPDGRHLAFTDYTAKGYDIRVMELDALGTTSGVARMETQPVRRNPLGGGVARRGGLQRRSGAKPMEVRSDRTPQPARERQFRPSTDYSPLDTILPRLWFPWLAYSPASGTLAGFVTGGQDVLQRHRYTLTALYGPKSGRLMHWADYTYDGLRPTLRLLLLGLRPHLRRPAPGRSRQRRLHRARSAPSAPPSPSTSPVSTPRRRSPSATATANSPGSPRCRRGRATTACCRRPARSVPRASPGPSPTPTATRSRSAPRAAVGSTSGSSTTRRGSAANTPSPRPPSTGTSTSRSPRPATCWRPASSSAA